MRKGAWEWPLLLRGRAGQEANLHPNLQPHPFDPGPPSPLDAHYAAAQTRLREGAQVRPKEACCTLFVFKEDEEG